MASLGTRQILYADRLESTIGTLLLIHDRDGHIRALDFHDFAFVDLKTPGRSQNAGMISRAKA